MRSGLELGTSRVSYALRRGFKSRLRYLMQLKAGEIDMSHRKLKFLKARKVAAAAATLGAVGIPAATASAATAPHVDSANTVEMQAVKVNTASYHHHKADTGNITYKVVPGDNLFDIAKVHLGDGDKWTEIYDANKGHAETDNRGNVQSFDNPDFIRPGWLLSVTSAPGRGWMSGPQDGSPSSGSGQQDGSPTPSPTPTQSAPSTGQQGDGTYTPVIAPDCPGTASGYCAHDPSFWIPLIEQAEQIVPLLGGEQTQSVVTRITIESSGDPNAINNYDSNAQNGDPSRGLMQTIGATFNAYHVDGTSTNIYDPLANICAALAYINAEYGGVVPLGSSY